jgi:formylglycine-generating enzyme required for sulfatase activity
MLQAKDTIGDYRLVEEVSTGELTRTWKAEQVSIQRKVIVEMLNPRVADDAEVKSAFLSDIKAKAAVAHPAIGAVYEAGEEKGTVFYVREAIPGESLEKIYHDIKKYTPHEVVMLLEQIGSAQRHLEKRRLATVPLAAHHVVIEDFSVRLVNLVAAGERDETQAAQDKHLLGRIFEELLISNLPGSTRVGSLLGFMVDLERDIPLTWRQVRDLSRQVIDQFDSLKEKEPPKARIEAPQISASLRSRTPPRVWAALGGVAAMMTVFGMMLAYQDEKVVKEPEQVVDLSPVPIAEGKTLGRHEVTIAQYADFLDSLSMLPNQDRDAFDHPGQPESKEDHVPDDWQALKKAIERGGVWKGRLVNDSCPVVGVDWWDAFAYSKWQGGRLPTLKEWQSASGSTVGIAGWGKASAPKNDRTDLGLIGMAGNVREWMLKPELNPNAPLQPEKPLACGGSFKEPASGVKTVTWYSDQSARRDDLGFRILLEE